jgi:hypothetical protein
LKGSFQFAGGLAGVGGLSGWGPWFFLADGWPQELLWTLSLFFLDFWSQVVGGKRFGRPPGFVEKDDGIGDWIEE